MQEVEGIYGITESSSNIRQLGEAEACEGNRLVYGSNKHRI